MTLSIGVERSATKKILLVVSLVRLHGSGDARDEVGYPAF
jgi:hypothetical protein